MSILPRGDSHVIKDKECSSKILERTPKRYPDLVLWAWLENFLTPKGLPILILHIISCHNDAKDRIMFNCSVFWGP